MINFNQGTILILLNETNEECLDIYSGFLYQDVMRLSTESLLALLDCEALMESRTSDHARVVRVVTSVLVKRLYLKLRSQEDDGK